MGIREIRRARNITQKELADAIGVSATVVSRYETGSIIPSSDRLRKIADYLQVSLAMLTGEKEGATVSSDQTSKLFDAVDLDKYLIEDFPVARKIIKESNGKCELCGEQAPFNYRDGTPYLESHFVQWLSEGGSPTIDNVVALCPNCHKKIHVLHLQSDLVKLREAAAKHILTTVDYIYEHKDKEILIEQKTTGRENRKRLLDYYSKILSARNGELSKERQQALDRLVENMTEQEAGEKFSAMGNDTYDKLMAYLSVLLKLTQKEQEIADALEDVLEATEN